MKFPAVSKRPIFPKPTRGEDIRGVDSGVDIDIIALVVSPKYGSGSAIHEDIGVVIED